MKIKMILFLLFLSLTFGLCSCSLVPGDMQNPSENTKYQMLLNSGSCFVFIFQDKETGVWYISTPGGVTPRLNADGTLYVSE